MDGDSLDKQVSLNYNVPMQGVWVRTSKITQESEGFDTHELFREVCYPSYSQVALIDADSPDYPQWETGMEAAVFTASGIAVATASTTDGVPIEVVVCHGEDCTSDFLRLSVVIVVGIQGLEVVDPTAVYATLAWPPGKTRVQVFTNSDSAYPHHKVTRVTFALKHENGQEAEAQ